VDCETFQDQEERLEELMRGLPDDEDEIEQNTGSPGPNEARK
jgi:hypothetical protein